MSESCMYECSLLPPLCNPTPYNTVHTHMRVRPAACTPRGKPLALCKRAPEKQFGREHFESNI